MRITRILSCLAVPLSLAIPACGGDKDAGPLPEAEADDDDDDDPFADGGAPSDDDDDDDDEEEEEEDEEEEEEEEVGSSDGGDDFIPKPDIDDGPQCDLWAQDCPEGDKCAPAVVGGGAAWNSTACVPVDPEPSQPGDECFAPDGGASGMDDCDVGSMCWDVDPESFMGTCVSLCTGDPGNPICEDPEATCVIANEGTLTVCLPQCDPLVQDCPEGQACYPVGVDWTCAPDVSGDLGTYGDACQAINVCDGGLICVDASQVPGCDAAGGCCTEVCDHLDADADAACSGAGGGQQCEPWYAEGAVPPGYESVGACVIPS